MFKNLRYARLTSGGMKQRLVAGVMTLFLACRFIVPPARAVGGQANHPASALEYDSQDKNPTVGQEVEAIEGRGAKLIYLPPYSPDLSPIEHCWSKVKTALRAAGARTRRRLQGAIKQALSTITESDALAWFAHCGYRLS